MGESGHLPQPRAGEFAAVQAALRVAETRYRDVFTHAATGIVHVRADGSFLEVNPAWAAVLGYDSPEQYMAEVGNARNLWHDPAQREVFLQTIHEAGWVRGFQAQMRHRDGRVVWVALDARGIRDAAGTLVELHTSGLDITAAKVAEQALRESEARFRSVFLSSLEGILLTTAAGQILAANPAACAILRRSEAQLQAISCGALFDLPGEQVPAGLVPRPGRGPAHADIGMLRPDGSRFPAEITCSVFTDADGAAHLSLIIRDVSERRRVEEELRRASRAAEEANRAKSEFLSRMSHELRTPLNAVLGFAQLLELDLDAEHRQFVQQIRRAGQHLLNLINEVLDISRIEAGELSLSPEAVMVEELISDVATLMAPIAAAAGVSMRILPVDGGQLHVRADRQRMRQVLLNLISNAVKYNHRGGTVTISHHRGEQTVAIAVTDTGIGISPAEQARLFTPFERLSAAASDIEGTGVGLALSQRLAMAMGGRIGVTSARGKGSTFTLDMPALDTAPTDAGVLPSEPCAGPDSGHTAEPARAHLLCIEDNPANVRLLEAVLARRPGWTLAHAGLGQLGLDLAIADPPELILLDLHLPDMPGVEVLNRLQACPTTAAVPVVIVSADATPGQVERLQASGAHRYLTKPIDISEVLHLLDTIGPPAEHPVTDAAGPSPQA